MRRKMARIILATIILAGVMALLLASCGGSLTINRLELSGEEAERYAIDGREDIPAPSEQRYYSCEEVHSSKILFSLFQRRFKPSHDNISRLNSVLLVKRRRVTKRIIYTELLILHLAHGVVRQNVKRFQSLEL